MKNLIHFCFLALLVSKITCGEKLGELWVKNPENQKIAGSDNIPFNIGNFGHVPEGSQLQGIAYLATPIDACSELTAINIDKDDTSPILVVQRGECKFVTKAHYAQISGFKVLLIVDTEEENVEDLEMINDTTGLGYTISIPSLIVPKKHGNELIELIKSGTTVLLGLHFNWAQSPKPSYQIWLSSCNQLSNDFMKEFADYGSKLEEYTEFEPNYVYWPCQNCDLEHTEEKCIANGKFCAPDPDGDGPIQGWEALIEDLRQYCIHALYGKRYWSYVGSFSDCLKDIKNYNNLEACSDEKINNLGFDKGEISQCVNKTFVNKNNPDYKKTDNSLFSEFKKRYFEKGIVFWPSVIINDMHFRGNMEAKEVAVAICNSFTEQPGICDDPAFKWQYFDDVEGKVSFPTFLLVLVLMMVVFMCCFYYVYKRIVRREMTKEMTVQINAAVSQYFLMNEQNKSFSTQP